MRKTIFLALLTITLTFSSAAPWCFGQDTQKVSTVLEQNEFDIGFIGLHGGVYEQLLKYAPALNLKLRYYEDAEIESGNADLASLQVLYLQHTRAEDRDRYKKIFSDAKAKNPKLVVIAFQSSTADLFSSLGLDGVLTDDPQAAKYYGNTQDNLRRLLVYSGKTYLAKEWNVELPEESERQGIYHPDSPKRFDTAQEFILWLRSLNRIRPEQPRLLITVHGTHLAFQQPAVVDALIREAERQGAIAAAIVDGRSKNYETEASAFEPSAIIHTCHSMDSLPLRLSLDVPHLHSIFIRKQSIDQFQLSLDGLSGSELAFHVIGQELLGAIEPQVGGGTRGGQSSSEAIEPIPDRIQHLVARALAYASLRAKLPEQKRIAVVYYDREMGKGELMRGSSTGMHMNAPRSLLNVLEKMKLHGYKIDPLPKFEDELLGWMMERGRQIGIWAPAELDNMVKHGSPALIPTDQYLGWYNQKIPADRRAQMEQRWGPPPGKFMVWSDGKQQFIVVPRIELGNIVLLPQPLRGELHGKETANSQTHDKVTTPPHNYMATYFWLEQAYGADAVVHFGTHGSEFALPGKPSGLSERDWPDILMGKLPNFNPWIIENMVESSPVKRRVYGTLISHLPPPIVEAGLSDDLENLHESLDKWEMLEEGALREGFRKEITKMVLACKLDVDLKLNLAEGKLFDDEQLREVGKYLHDIKEETTPISLHVFGEPPREDLLIPYLVQILRQPFLAALDNLLHDSSLSDANHQHMITLPAHAHDANGQHDLRPIAEQLVELVVRRRVEPRLALGTILGREVTMMPEEIEKGLKLALDLSVAFQRTTDEVDNLLKALDGRFVPPGPGNSPIRNPSAVPTGRNM
ncbi:MAG: cobaltochelatase subunit CobN, partial [Pirellulales bacterium]